MGSSNSPDVLVCVARTLLETQSDAIVAADRGGVIRFWNPGAERIFGFSTSDAVGQSLDIIIPPKLRVRHWMGWAQFLRVGESHYGNGDVLSVPALTAGGRALSVEFTISVFRDGDGEIDGVVAVMRDVTARFEEMRELRRQFEAMGAGGAT